MIPAPVCVFLPLRALAPCSVRFAFNVGMIFSSEQKLSVQLEASTTTIKRIRQVLSDWYYWVAARD
jgi:hypothetical protein